MVFTKRSALIATAWFVFCLSVPTVLLIAGQRSVNLEGAAPTPAPALEWGSLFDTDKTAEYTSWFATELPVRDNAITMNAAADRFVFNDRTSPGVIPGTDGWYFTNDDAVKAACNPAAKSAEDLRADIDRMDRVATDAGVELLVVISPDKSPIEREHFPKNDPARPCVMSYNQALRSAFGANPPPWRPDLWTLMDSVKRRNGTVFYETDSHMNPAARIELAQATVNAIRPGLFTDADVHDVGTRRRSTDLSRQAGLPRVETAEYFEVERPGVTTTPEIPRVDTDRSPVPESFVHYRSTGAATIPGRTVIVHDSQFQLAAADIAPFFADVTFVHWNFWGDPRVAATVAQADTLIVESVQRAANERLGGPMPDLMAKTLG